MSRCRMCSAALRSFLFYFHCSPVKTALKTSKHCLQVTELYTSLPSCQNIVPSHSLQLICACFLFAFLQLSSLSPFVLSCPACSVQDAHFYAITYDDRFLLHLLLPFQTLFVLSPLSLSKCA
ncbi:hypothetical protein AMECASPLE_002495 [Ameca splendens]|uniref:Secreted protein n=1 Tax=Ameca splendens TaxID=208324 RepID=A0ABV0XY87_9TELE